MKLHRMRIHHLIEQLRDEDLEEVWQVLHSLYCDLYMLQAIQEVKQKQQPWDNLTYDEATRLLMFR
jgi:endonuclease/exonuclease/phosphatase family metal-dependent hydrolase